MKTPFLKLMIFVTMIPLINACYKIDNKIMESIQGKWYNTDGTEKTIEINGNKWIEDVQEFGKTIYQINTYNDSIFEIRVIENTNTITRFQVGMKDYIKIKLDTSSDIIHFEYTDTTGRNGFNRYFTKNKAKIQPYRDL